MTAQATRMQAELDADLECLKTEGLAAETVAQLKVLESLEGGSNVENISDIQLPTDNPQERTKSYVESLTNIKPVPQTFRNTSNEPNDIQVRASVPMQTQSIDSEVQIKLNPEATPYFPVGGDVFQAPTQEPVYTQNYVVAQEMTNFLLKKELLLTRLRNFDDQPESYISWKSGFLCIVRETGLSDLEQLDLLLSWLGPSSSKQAISLKSSNSNNSLRDLKLIWERLDERYGAPEMVENALRNKLDKFPKLTNKDGNMLYELVDILSEIDSLKQNEPFKTVLSYFDSSVGVWPITRKLTYGLQEKWMTRAPDYKHKNNVPFPPFSFFVNFIQDMCRRLNDPSFAHDTTANNPNKKVDHRQGTSKVNVFTKKTEFSPQSKHTKETLTRCPLHNTKHTLNDCRDFKRKSVQERREFLKEQGICLRCCDTNKHFAKNCDAVLFCKDCSSDRHDTALHVGKPYTRDVISTTSPPTDDDGETTPLHLSSKCTQLNDNHFNGKSFSKNILVSVYPKGQPHNSRRVYAILDEQSNVSLARSEFFELFQEHGLSSPYTLSSCNGRTDTYGRRAKDYVVSSLDGSTRLDLSLIVECDHIPDMRDEIPTPDVAAAHPHLTSITSLIPQIDNNAQILLLIGRDIPEAHHVLKQLTGGYNSPYAQQLSLGWVIVGETCLGKVHRPDYSINKTHILKNGRPSIFIPCDSEISVKSNYEPIDMSVNSSRDDDIVSNVFLTSRNDNKKGMSIEDRDFIKIMEDTFIKGEDGNWIAPLPFREPRQRLSNNRAQAFKRAKTLHTTLVRNPTKKEQFFEFISKILDAGHAEIAQSMEPDRECWYLPLFGAIIHRSPDKYEEYLIRPLNKMVYLSTTFCSQGQT